LDENISILDISNRNLKLLPDLSKFINLKRLFCHNNCLTSLPDDLPITLRLLNCANNCLTSLPDNLPNILQSLLCWNNKLTYLPDNLPNTLLLLKCNDNCLTSLSDNLPNTLKSLLCWNNKLTSLPDNLPNSLRILNCYDNYLTSLPDTLPNNLQELYCHDMSIYPNLNMLLTTQDKILYIQKINTDIGVIKCRQWLKIVNENNIFLEKYMMKQCHPNNLNIIKTDKTIDLDLFVNNFIENL
jgi:Leucine-rich repeat (LRR) protein